MRAVVTESGTGAVHKFEVAGLGKAPFRFTGEVTEKTYVACQGAPVQPGSTCDYCGTAIRYEFWIESSDARRSKVGCDCIRKHGDAGLLQAISAAERKLRDAKNARAREAKAARLAVRIEEAMALLPAIRGTLADLPHPVQHHADNSLTMLDYIQWLLANGYNERAALVIEKTQKKA